MTQVFLVPETRVIALRDEVRRLQKAVKRRNRKIRYHIRKMRKLTSGFRQPAMRIK